ncbi:MAG: efflux RND transporter periplasmic adaptor subunit [Burkholderiales bacterium]|nr:efflux RND transporter periplasmic adaptor subunit [Burkholderiales bacterium]
MSLATKPSSLHITLALTATAMLAALVGTAAVGARTSQGAPAPAAAAALEFAPTDILTVEAQRLQRALPLTGTLTPRTEARVKAKVAGEILAMSVREGEAVRRGQVLARIDQTEVEARVAARTAELEAARAQLVLAEKNRSTQKALLERNFISRNAFDATDSSFEVAAAKLRAAEAELAMARKSQGDALLVAPFDGVISARHARQGERVSVDAPVVSVVDLARLELEAAVPAAHIARVEIGQPVAFRVDGFGEREFSGRIERISPATVAGTRSINVYAVIDNRDGALRGGLFAQGRLIWDQVDDAIVVPASAVREEAGSTVVYAIEAGTLRRKPVKVMPADAEGRVQIVAGLAGGASIVRSNLGALPDGARARITRPAAVVN